MRVDDVVLTLKSTGQGGGGEGHSGQACAWHSWRINSSENLSLFSKAIFTDWMSPPML